MRNNYDSADPEKQDHQNVVILCDDDGILYGHDTLKQIARSNATRECRVIRGVPFECYIGFLLNRFRDHLCVQLLNRSKTVSSEMLERISDTVEIIPEDLVAFLNHGQ